MLDRESTQRLVAGLGERRLSVIGLPGRRPRPSTRSWAWPVFPKDRSRSGVALRALRDLAADLYGDGGILEDTPALN